jgi:uncharacterized protein DUF6301
VIGGTGWRELDPTAAHGLFEALRDTDWGWTVAEVPDLLRRLGWHLVAEVPDEGAVARTSAGLADVTLVYHGDRVRRVSVGVADRGDAPLGFDVAGRTEQAFAATVALATRLFGPPATWLAGGERFARWRGERASVTVAEGAGAVIVDWAPG